MNKRPQLAVMALFTNKGNGSHAYAGTLEVIEDLKKGDKVDILIYEETSAAGNKYLRGRVYPMREAPASPPLEGDVPF